MARGPYNVLFLCDGNSARSIFGECIVRKFGGDRFVGYSAGQKPLGSVHPLTLEVLEEYEHDIRGLRSKSTSEFLRPDAPVMDFVFTVCDMPDCATWPGSPITAQWKTADPGTWDGAEEARIWAFRRAYRELETRTRIFMNLKVESLDTMSLREQVTEIGRRRAPRSEAEEAGLQSGGSRIQDSTRRGA
jgi:protein-tyrosine-phosphatase